ncbi:MAG: LptF/LptG family permease, partial [Alphaproteobacteria bacterium]|nr:LptF/LptG family permease [Alphaproteobacteria bacterium]
MRLSPTLLRYLATRYLQFFLVVLLILATVIFLFEFAELLRRGLSKDVPFDLLFRMGLYKMPETLERALPFMVLFSGLITFWQLTRTQELVVVRATGLSAWQFLLPIILVVMLFSLLNLMVVNPVGAMFIGRFKEMENTYLRRLSGFELTSSGLWLRQQDQNRGRHYLMQSEKVTLNPLTLQPVMVLVYDDDRNYLGRIDAEEATLKKGAWHMAGATLHWSRQTPMSQSYTIPTDLTETRIQDSLAAPNTVSFWDLPHFIQALQSIGLPTQ